MAFHRANPQQDWDNTVDASVFYGPGTELAQLWQWIVIQRGCVVGLLGIGGIGKSTIAVKAALQMQPEFENRGMALACQRTLVR